MPSPVSADRPAAQPPGRGSVEALIRQTRRLKGDVDAVRRDTRGDGADPEERWQRALYDLALRQLNDIDAHLAQLRDGPPPGPARPEPPPAAPDGSLLARVGSAEWDLLTDRATWSAELYRLLGLDPAGPALTLDELPGLILPEDRPKLTEMVTACLVDAKPIDGEFRVVRPDGTVRTVHMMGEPVLGADGGTTSMWAVLRDISELRRSQRTVTETRDSLHRHRQTGRGIADGSQEAVPPPWHGSLRLPHQGPAALDLAAHRLPAATATLIGADWHDALELADGQTQLTVGGLTGQGVADASGTAMLLGAVRGMAMAGTRPGRLLTLLNRLLGTAARPAVGSAVCCRYQPSTRTLLWARAGHPAPLLYRDGTGRPLDAPDSTPLGTSSEARYEESAVTLRPGDLLLLHTGALLPEHDGRATVDRLLGLAPRFGPAQTARDCVRTVVEAFGGPGREDDACVLAAKVTA
ncbi:PP2C family protein-serine/threonine phosphatase [Streptomyces sp. SudanB182_2057]|uniref:PP2C family protein-serine/threonine phosphatase n=1 Tax=Streptomyces sp. SudanB182_2057 TaxID=3035281 RepID=UPI003F55D9A8